MVDQSQASNPEVDYEFAYDQLKGADIAGCFLSEVLKLAPEEKPAYIKEFAELLRKRITSLNKSLEKVYPRPDASLIHDWELADVTVEASAMLPSAFIEANTTLEQKDRLTPAQLNLLIEIGNPLAERALKSLQAGLINLADRARENELFVSFD